MNWEEKLKKKWYLHNRTELEIVDESMEVFTTCQEEVIGFISGLLKEQREMCESIYLKENGYSVTHTTLSRKILNAPEPGEK